MDSPPTLSPGVRLRRKLRRARAALLWERLWRLLWPVPALAILFLALAGFDVLPHLSPWSHAGVLAAFAVAFVYLLVRLFRLRYPTLDEARRRLEHDSGFDHRPLTTLSDRIAGGDSRDRIANALWIEQRRRQAALLARLRLRAPNPDLPRHDPWGLRFAPVLILAIALAGSWEDYDGRLTRALVPDIGALGGPPPTLQVWITPPAYTRVAPMMLQGAALKGQTALSLPAGSKFMAELSGGHADAELRLDDKKTPFQRLDEDNQRIEMTLSQGGKLVIHQGWFSTVATWQLSVAEDQPPIVAFAQPPSADSSGRLKLEVAAEDDYGVARTWVTIRRSDKWSEAHASSPLNKPVVVPLPLPGNHPQKLHQTATQDLTDNPWAGLPVTITPGAEDDAKQQAEGESVRILLPERPFRNPLARAVVALRRQLVADPEKGRPIAEAGIAAILGRPESFGKDFTIYLALSDSRSRLFRGKLEQILPSVLDMMWQTALRLEDGDRPSAQRALDNARAALDNALANKAPQSELDRLTQELRAALNRYLQALMEEAQRNPQTLPAPGPNDKVISGRELNQMIDKLEEMARTGSPDAARQALAQLQQLLDQLRNARPMQAGPGQNQQGQQEMNALNDIMKNQRNLLDQTFRNSRNPQQRGQPDQPGQDSQESIRKQLGDAMQQLGDMGVPLPDQMGEAEQAMRDSSQALSQGDMKGAMEAQNRALSKLQQGMQQAQQAMNQQGYQMGDGPGVVGTSQMPGQAPDRDPLGRPLANSGTGDDNSVKIPTQSDTQKAREILDDLRRRAGDAQRPPGELDYLNRLLRQFQ